MLDLSDALQDTRSVISELEAAHAYGTRTLRARIDLVAAASTALDAGPSALGERIALTQLVREIRDEALDLRRRHRVVQRIVLSMMD